MARFKYLWYGRPISAWSLPSYATRVFEATEEDVSTWGSIHGYVPSDLEPLDDEARALIAYAALYRRTSYEALKLSWETRSQGVKVEKDG